MFNFQQNALKDQRFIDYMILSTIGKIFAIFFLLYFLGLFSDFISFLLTDRKKDKFQKITFNPIKTFSIIGIVMMLFVGIGFVKPRKFTKYDYKDEKKGIIIKNSSVIAYYFVMALIFLSFLYLSKDIIGPTLQQNFDLIGDKLPLYAFLTSFLMSTFTIYLFMGIFNILPIAPTSMFEVLDAVLTDEQKMKPGYIKYKMFGIFIILLILIFLSSYINAVIKNIVLRTIGFI